LAGIPEPQFLPNEQKDLSGGNKGSEISAQFSIQDLPVFDLKIISIQSLSLFLFYNFCLQLLIKLIEQEHDRFYDATCKKANIYALICNEMNKSGFPCMPHECQKKWESLRVSVVMHFCDFPMDNCIKLFGS